MSLIDELGKSSEVILQILYWPGIQDEAFRCYLTLCVLSEYVISSGCLLPGLLHFFLLFLCLRARHSPPQGCLGIVLSRIQGLPGLQQGSCVLMCALGTLFGHCFPYLLSLSKFLLHIFFFHFENSRKLQVLLPLMPLVAGHTGSLWPLCVETVCGGSPGNRPGGAPVQAFHRFSPFASSGQDGQHWNLRPMAFLQTKTTDFIWFAFLQTNQKWQLS